MHQKQPPAKIAMSFIKVRPTFWFRSASTQILEADDALGARSACPRRLMDPRRRTRDGELLEKLGEENSEWIFWWQDRRDLFQSAGALQPEGLRPKILKQYARRAD